MVCCCVEMSTAYGAAARTSMVRDKTSMRLFDFGRCMAQTDVEPS